MIDKEDNAIQSDDPGVKYLYDCYFQESHNISHRTDWFLIFHAILLEAFFGAKELAEITEPAFIQMIVGGIGILVSFYWAVTGVRTWVILWNFGGYMRDKNMVGQSLAAMHNKIYEDRMSNGSRKRIFPWAKPSIVFLMVIPILFTISWLAIYLINFQTLVSYGILGLALFTSAIINIILHIVDKKMVVLYGVNGTKE